MVAVFPEPRTYYILAKADGANVLAEKNETNNVSARILRVGADLVAAVRGIAGTPTGGATPGPSGDQRAGPDERPKRGGYAVVDDRLLPVDTQPPRRRGHPDRASQLTCSKSRFPGTTGRHLSDRPTIVRVEIPYWKSVNPTAFLVTNPASCDSEAPNRNWMSELACSSHC
jgi:hypothetical protein